MVMEDGEVELVWKKRKSHEQVFDYGPVPGSVRRRVTAYLCGKHPLTTFEETLALYDRPKMTIDCYLPETNTHPPPVTSDFTSPISLRLQDMALSHHQSMLHVQLHHSTIPQILRKRWWKFPHTASGANAIRLLCFALARGSRNQKKSVSIVSNCKFQHHRLLSWPYLWNQFTPGGVPLEPSHWELPSVPRLNEVRQ
ncbi:hypothetical protein Drorol1_Dr00004001 [Drosera rotundifolia]